MNMSAPVVEKAKPNLRIGCLDGLRAISIGFVIASHARKTVDCSVPPLVDAVWDSAGELGVQVFFGLSGYLITFLLVKEYMRTGTISLRNFYIRRVLRIFPAFYSYLAVMALLVWAGVIHIPWRLLLETAAYIKNYVQTTPADHSWFVGHSWSLAVEQQFYLIWPLLFIGLGIRKAKYAALAFIVMMPLSRVACWYLLPGTRNSIGGTIHTCMDLLMFGCLLALLDGHPGFESFMKKLSSWVYPAAAIFFIAIIDPIIVHYLHTSYRLPFGLTIDCALISFVIAWFVRNPDSRGAIFLNTAPMVYAGVLSYSLYLWQQPFMTVHNRTIMGHFPLNVILSFLMAAVSYHLIEKRFLAMRSRYCKY